MMNACGFGRKQGDTQCPLKGLCRPRVARRVALKLAAVSRGWAWRAGAAWWDARAARSRWEVMSAPGPRGRPRRVRARHHLRRRLCQTLWVGPTPDDATQVCALGAGAERCDEIAWTPDGTACGVSRQRLPAANVRCSDRTPAGTVQPDRSRTARRPHASRAASRSRRTARRDVRRLPARQVGLPGGVAAFDSGRASVSSRWGPTPSACPALA